MVSAWRSAFGPNEVIQRVRPHETDAYIPNPHKGTTTFQRFNGDPLFPGTTWSDREGPETFKPPTGNPKNLQYPDTTIAYCRWVWSVIEPDKGKFRWDIIDGALQTARQHGQSLQVRLQPSAGGAPYPDWFWKSGAYKCNPKDLHPDFNCPAYVLHWTNLIKAFAARYDGHPDLESFDIAYAGGCGETGGNSTPETAAQLVDAYINGFKKTQLIGMGGTHGFKYALTKRSDIGWRDDCFGDVHMGTYPGVPKDANWNHMYDGYPRQLFECNAVDAWRRAPVIFETCWTVGYWYEQGWDIDWILAQGLTYHLSVFMPKSSYIPEEWSDKIVEFNKRMGYRFVPRQLTLPLEAKPAQQFEYNMWVDNVGVAPIYRPYRLAFRFRQGNREEVVQSEQDIRTWMPDHTWFKESITFPGTLKCGVVNVDIGIVDPKTDKPRVKFAIKDVLEDGWHPMTCMDVL